MQARLQEIKERQEIYSCEDSEFIINAKHDIKFLLDELEQAQKNSDNQKIVIDTLLEAIEGWKTELQQSQEEIKKIQKETISANNNLIYVRDRERVLREALRFYANKDNYYATNEKHSNGLAVTPIIEDRCGNISREALKEDNP